MEQPDPEALQIQKVQGFRQNLVYAYLLFLLLWFGLLSFVVLYLEVGTLEALGLGTATGVFLAAFKDMWQFIWRKK